MRPYLSLLLLAAALLAAALWFTRDRDVQLRGQVRPFSSESEVPALATEDALRTREIELDPAQRDAGFARTAAAAPAALDTRLFDDSLPLADRIAELDRLARRGDAGAGCQVGYELLRCRQARNLADYHDNIENQVRNMAARNGNAQDVDRQIDAALERRARSKAILALCEGVDEKQWAAPARYLRAAAESGHVEAMRTMLDPQLYRADALFRDPGLIPLFRDAAPRYFRRLMESGDALILNQWSNASYNTETMLLDALPAPFNQAALAREMNRLNGAAAGAPPRPQEPGLGAEQAAEAARMFDRWFAPRLEEVQAERKRLAGRQMGDLDYYRCDAVSGD